MDKKTSAKRFDAAEFFNKILGSRFLLTIFSIVISFVVGAAFMLIIGINPLVALTKLETLDLSNNNKLYTLSAQDNKLKNIKEDLICVEL